MSQKIGQGMIYLAWFLLLALLTLAANTLLEKQNNPNQNLASDALNNRMAEVILEQNRQGHYVATGRINTNKVTFLLDTGATQISIPEKIADQLHLKKGYPLQVMTANGSITVYSTDLKQVSLGSITLNNLKAHINPYMNGDEILLGMNFMRHLEIIQRNQQLSLRHYN
ncbi:MAG: TIGR02281 family clan AA aspartic protease [Methylococcales bacterium]|nr:TIGR02281 family clan AA aspartic protease [Methylococcales bacterium]